MATLRIIGCRVNTTSITISFSDAVDQTPISATPPTSSTSALWTGNYVVSDPAAGFSASPTNWKLLMVDDRTVALAIPSAQSLNPGDWVTVTVSGIGLASSQGTGTVVMNPESIHRQVPNDIHRATRDVDHVIGAFFLIRQALFKHLSGFDERFFVYLEDLDLSLRVHRHGYRSMYLSDAQAFHVGGGTSRQVKAHRLFYSLRSRLLYGFKHFSTHQAWALLLTIVFLEPFTRSFFAILRRSALDLSATLRAYGMLYRDLPRILRIRQES